MKTDKGFSLIELMVVIALIAIMAGIAVPNFQTYMKNRRLSGAASQLFVDLMNARMQAVSQNMKIIVSLENNHQYKIIRDLNGNGTIDAGEDGPLKDIHPDYYDVTFAAASSGFNPIFNANGTGMQGTINISSSSISTTKTITMSTAGRIKVQ
jgi:prepilin-type N-terminal cleavage/methylation domain-containing protein